jgi:tRNA A-37 threonylcarbamoyl transferase component Bud32
VSRQKAKSSTAAEDEFVRLEEALSRLAPVRRLAGRNWTKADLLVYRIGERQIALKDYGPTPAWLRNTLGRLLVRREARAYEAASGLEGVPRCFGRIGPYALALEWVEGKPLAAFAGSEVGPDVLSRLGSVLSGLHERGIALGDLHHRDVLVGDRGEVWIVDLATAFWLGPRPGPLRRLLFRRMAEQDRIALARLRARFTGKDERQAILAEVGDRAARRYGRARKMKSLWDRIRGRRRRRAEVG